ncbi:MAG TPA: radical SAM protein, partial [Terriglobales bacterium]
QEFAYEVESRSARIPFKIQARADLMTRDTAHLLARAGCEEVWMGVESGSQHILDAMEKGLRVEQVPAAREFLREAGIRACFFLQFGYPGETWSDIRKTIDLVRRSRPDDIGVSLSYPLPNTRFYENVRAELGTKRNWSDSDDLCVMFKGTYSDDFYRLVRDTLHLEVRSWSNSNSATTLHVQQLWKEIEVFEPLSRNRDATHIPSPVMSAETFVPLQQISMGAGD